MSVVSDQQEFERLYRLPHADAGTVTEFQVGIRADRSIDRDEVAALLSQRFPFLVIDAGTDRATVDRL